MLSYIDNAPKTKTQHLITLISVSINSHCAASENTPYPGSLGLLEFYVTEKALWTVPVSNNEDN